MTHADMAAFQISIQILKIMLASIIQTFEGQLSSEGHQTIAALELKVNKH